MKVLPTRIVIRIFLAPKHSECFRVIEYVGQNVDKVLAFIFKKDVDLVWATSW